jgi:hypothetical protein
VTDTHVVSALKEKRVQVASQPCRASYGAVIDLDHVEAALLLFDPGVDLAALPARKIAPVSYPVLGSKLPKAASCSLEVRG